MHERLPQHRSAGRALRERSETSNYPDAGVQAAFLAAVQGTLPAGNTTVAFAPYATLLSMQQIEVYGGGVQTIQTWQITSTGTITAGKTAQVEVSATLETPKFPAQMYAAFGTAGGCGTLNFHGNQTQTDSYDSGAALVGGNPVISNSGGNVGTNGNLTEGGGADIYGTLSSPRVGVGACSDGNVNALSSSGGATVNGHDPLQPGDIVQLPQAVVAAPADGSRRSADDRVQRQRSDTAERRVGRQRLGERELHADARRAGRHERHQHQQHHVSTATRPW